MPGVVSIPHGWGHDAPGVRLGVAAEHAGVNSNLLAPVEVDVPSGNAVLNGIPVEVTAADREPAPYAVATGVAQLEFDEETSKRIEAAYSSRDVLRRRALVARGGRAPSPASGSSTSAAARASTSPSCSSEVGPEGAVDRRRRQRRRCWRWPRSASEGRATSSSSRPTRPRCRSPTTSFDAALSVQVLEYVADIAAALAEIHRALRPGRPGW